MSEVFTKPPKPGVKLSKEDAGYVAEGPFGCKNCTWLTGTGNCAVVGGRVSKNGCCDFWNDKDAPKNVGKTGAEYVYVAPYTYTCSICKFFDSKTKTCTPVVGPIAPGGSCNKWMPMDNIKASLLFPGAAGVIREAVTEQLQEANPMNGTGGRVAKTDPDTLAALNAPCSTCGHSYNSHSLEGKKCFHCTPKGSQHSYHESPDMAPHLVKVPTSTSDGQLAKPEVGITGMVQSGRTYEAAAERLMETYFAPMNADIEHNKAIDSKGEAQRRALMLYNAHSTAAHRSSTMAYAGGGDSSAAHQVASEHHKLAAGAASDAADKADNIQTKKDLQTASKYHTAQATAHKAASTTQQSGNRQPYS